MGTTRDSVVVARALVEYEYTSRDSDLNILSQLMHSSQHKVVVAKFHYEKAVHTAISGQAKVSQNVSYKHYSGSSWTDQWV